MFCASGGGQREQTEKTLKIEKKKNYNNRACVKRLFNAL